MIVIDFAVILLPELLLQTDDVCVVHHSEITNSLLRKYNPSVLIIRSTVKVNKELLEGTSVKFIATATSGSDHIDKKYCRSVGIEVFVALGCNATSVAEYVLNAILDYTMLMTTGNTDLQGVQLGVIGCGHIGKRVAYMGAKLGMNVLINDPPAKSELSVWLSEINAVLLEQSLPQIQYGEFDDVLHKSDILTNHVPLIRDGLYATKELFNPRTFELMKDNGCFIHASRGGVVNETALKQTIINKKLVAYIDVWDGEPDWDIELAKLSRMSTPHIAGHSFNGKLHGSLMVAHWLRSTVGMNIRLLNEGAFLSKVEAVEVSLETLPFLRSHYIHKYNEVADDSLIMRNGDFNDLKKTSEWFVTTRTNYPSRYEAITLPEF
jgi:erythronate-4-phosphate dehydrogenase